jgi:hypothetical protein
MQQSGIPVRRRKGKRHRTSGQRVKERTHNVIKAQKIACWSLRMKKRMWKHICIVEFSDPE